MKMNHRDAGIQTTEAKTKAYLLVAHPAAGDRNTEIALAEKSTPAAEEKRQQALAPNESAPESRSNSAARENRRHP
jgi:hypothetical protein